LTICQRIQVDAKRRILAYLARRRSATGADLRSHLDISRQALSVHVRSLVEAGKVVRSGTARAARYMLRDRAPAAAVVARALRTRDLEESRIWDELATGLNLRRALRPNVESIVHYAFTEMLNNAIEHSHAERCFVRFRFDPGTLSFEIRDPGIGAFHSIASKLRLDGEHTALVELLKGRTTTMREAHTGEGIFFTSRVADRFVLRSHRIQVEWSRIRNDVFVSSPRFLKGTSVHFAIQRNSRLRLEAVFGEFAPEEFDYQFQKTRVLVKLLRRDYVSRSEAKRLVANLEKFREVVIDFREVKSVGQGFADEVFRVFAGQHPGVKITTENANPAVDAMIRHVRP
jgi:DNA-binding MarR family transcriptional regulator/anti-sigma regulatory factor (Ser/Thr protein kinase)